MRRVIFPLLLLTTVCHAEIYKWVDPDGVTHFSDREHDGADRVNLQPLQTYGVAKEDQNSFNPKKTKEPQQAVNYQLSISSPANEATIRNNQGEIQVSLRLTPELEPEQKIRLLLDGKPVAEAKALNLQILNVDRGAHKLQAELVEQSGKVLASTEIVTVYVHRPIAPNLRNRPLM